jgi:alginate O-acetyltransferase complex protein AlgI
VLFNSFEFALFLLVVFTLYWAFFAKEKRRRNAFLLVASYTFYGFWDARFLLLIALSTIVDYNVARHLHKTDGPGRRRGLLAISLCVNLGLLGFFKYWNFFIDSWVDLWGAVGVDVSGPSLDLILPVGISFYTFQTLSYTIDIYRRRLEPAEDFVSFAAFLSFFPQLVAGPIERARNLLPQFQSVRTFDRDQAVDGLRQMLWGLGKKVVIADACAVHVNRIFADWESMPSSMLVLGAVLFAFQIYGDFSGYSDIAIGCARLFGFSLMRNFAYPYFSRDIAEFWRRWHISLSTWFRDYVYIPLGGSRTISELVKLRNIFVIFVVSGFWHGANWTFVVWGALNAAYYVPLSITGRNRRHGAKDEPTRLDAGLRDLHKVALTFALTCVAWVFFRAESVGDAVGYLRRIVVNDVWFRVPERAIVEALGLIALLVVVEWVQRRREHAFDLRGVPVWLRWPAYAVVLLASTNAILGGSSEFIYFQF